MKIRSRFLLYLMSFYSIVVLIGVFSQYYSFRFFNSYLYDSVSEIFHSSVGTFTSSIHNIEQLTITVMANEATQDYLKQDLLKGNDYEKNIAREALMQKLSLYTLLNPFIKEIVLVDSDNKIYHADTNTSNNIDFDKLVRGSIRERTLALNGKQLWSVTDSSIAPLVLSRKINLIGNYIEQPSAVLFYFIDIEKLLKENLSQINQYKLKTSINYNGELFYSQLNGESTSIREKMGSHRYGTIWFNGEPHFATRVATDDGKWNFLFLIPTQDLFRDFYNMNRIVYLIYFAFFIISTFFVITSTGLITSPIITLSRKMKEIDDKDFISSEPFQLPAKASDEVTLLYREFYQMIEKIDTLVNKNLKQQLSLNEAQLEALSNQLNPHFLYNTLDSLYWMAEINRQPEMASMVKSLSTLLRSSLNKSEPLISVKDQLDLLNDYFYIQKIRFKERLEYVIDVDERAYPEKIPCFTLQPLVENSIKYSLEEMKKKCLIEVTINFSGSGDGMDILIRDNGPGLKGDFSLEEKQGIGLANLKQRIGLLYGEKGRMEISNNESGGTDIRIFVPLTRETIA